eukprot:1060274-Pyramimonas_sp.AAC.1
MVLTLVAAYLHSEGSEEAEALLESACEASPEESVSVATLGKMRFNMDLATQPTWQAPAPGAWIAGVADWCAPRHSSWLIYIILHTDVHVMLAGPKGREVGESGELETG